MTKQDSPLSKEAIAFCEKIYQCHPPCDSWGICTNCAEKINFVAGYNFGYRAQSERIAETEKKCGLYAESAGQYEMENVRLRKTFEMLSKWDHWDTLSDGTYWKQVIAKVLSKQEPNEIKDATGVSGNKTEPKPSGRADIKRTNGIWIGVAEPDVQDFLKKEDHGCMTGDCPHEKQSECDKALARDYPEQSSQENPLKTMRFDPNGGDLEKAVETIVKEARTSAQIAEEVLASHETGLDLLAANWDLIGMNRSQTCEVMIYFGLSQEQANKRLSDLARKEK